MSTSGIALAVSIDDNDIDLFVQKRFLEINHFARQIITFRSPLDALDYFESAKELPEIILLDLNMPVMDGFEFLDKYLQLPEKITSQSKVVVLTSSSSGSDRERASTYPCVIGFISKPMELKNLDDLRQHFLVKPDEVPHQVVKVKK